MSYDEEKDWAQLLVSCPRPRGWMRAAQEPPAARAALDELVARAQADAELRRRILN